MHAQWLVCAVDTITEKKRIACKVIRNNRNSYVIGSFDFNLNVHYVRYFIDKSFIVLSLCFFYHIHFEVNKLVKSSNHVLLLLTIAMLEHFHLEVLKRINTEIKLNYEGENDRY